jgi:hypothetical protein
VSAIPQDPTLQEVFDHVARHLLKQGERCSDGETDQSNGCLMALGRKRCAVGSLLGVAQIKDAKRRDLNRASLWTPGVSDLVAESLGVTEITAECVDLLDRLQRIHDNRSVGLWPPALRSLAEEWGFGTSALSDAKVVRR